MGLEKGQMYVEGAATKGKKYAWGFQTNT
jgi:hypothetical protein